jgi:class 3 adenylate cyclase
MGCARARPQAACAVVREQEVVEGGNAAGGELRGESRAEAEAVIESGGIVEHLAGDGVTAFVNDPVAIRDRELAAIRAAVATTDRFGGLALDWEKRGYDLGVGIGIATGYATLGRIGFAGRYD